MGVSANDVSVVTNVSADHLGLQGIDTVDQLAEVKSVVTKVTRPTGWAVLNGEDPRVFAMRAGTRARTWVYALSADSPAIRATLNEGGRAVTVLDGEVVVLMDARSDPEHLVAIQDIPVTLAGLSPHNTANVLAATAAAGALGLERRAIVEGLLTFVPDAEHNPGRMNLFEIAGVLIVVDFAHNPEGLAALLGVANGLRSSGAAVRLALSAAGDRRDEDIMRLGELAAQGADDVVAVRVDRYLRGRTPGEMQGLFAEGAAHVGREQFEEAGGEVLALAALMNRASQGDVVAVMAHAERAELLQWLASRAAVPVTHEALVAHLTAVREP
jgi:cyanophycin synthetase